MTSDASHSNGTNGPTCDHSHDEPLTRNERLVLDVLSRQEEPMKAYALLASLKSKGVKAPMTVYRALDRLELKGLVHKLDGMNSFVLCNHDAPHPLQVFLICTNCSRVEEVKEHNVGCLDWNVVQAIGHPMSFRAESTRVEIRGFCRECDG